MYEASTGCSPHSGKSIVPLVFFQTDFGEASVIQYENILVVLHAFP